MNKLSVDIPLAPSGGFKGPGTGPLSNPTAGGGTGIEAFTKFISSTIGLMTIIAIIWFIFVLMTGAISMISAGSDKQALESARKRIINGLTGLVIVVAAIFIIEVIGRILGLKDILNLSYLFSQITK